MQFISRRASATLVALGLILAGGASSKAANLAGVGVAGDSYTDEYQFYPPDRSTARNFVEILSAVNGVNFGSFSTASRGTPRNQGFANDWGLTDTTTADLAPQAAGLAAQVTAGQVSYVLLFSGGNDFRFALGSGQSSPAQLSALVSSMLGNVESAVSTITSAGNVKVVIGNLPDVQLLPETQGAIQAGIITQTQANNASAAEAAYNSQLAAAYVGNPNVAIFDAADTVAGFLTQPTITVAGVTLDPFTPSDDFHSAFLADGVHIGTIAQGELFAKGFTETLDSSFNAGFLVPTDQQIVTFAEGIAAQSVPLPPAWAMTLTMIPLLAGVCYLRRKTV